VVEIIHLLALALFGGGILLVDLRFLGLAFRSQSSSQIAKELLPLTLGGVAAMAVSGFLLFMGGTMRYYHNPAFRLKMLLFAVALVFHFALQTREAKRVAGESERTWPLKAGALFSLALWLSIGLAGRAIGYV
jgi:hypothetical protein